MVVQYAYQIPNVEATLVDHKHFVEEVIGLKRWTPDEWNFDSVVVIIHWIFILLLFLLVGSTTDRICSG
jgi:hypothetical protein